MQELDKFIEGQVGSILLEHGQHRGRRSKTLEVCWLAAASNAIRDKAKRSIETRGCVGCVFDGSDGEVHRQTHESNVECILHICINSKVVDAHGRVAHYCRQRHR